MNRPQRIEKIQIENRSKWELTDCLQHVMNLIQTEREYLSEHRNEGCTFRFRDGVNIGILPVSRMAPEDTLCFYINNDITRGK